MKTYLTLIVIIINYKQLALRFFTVYGSYGRPDMAYFDFTKKIINNKKITLFNEGKLSGLHLY